VSTEIREEVLHDHLGNSVFAESSLESPSDCELQAFEQLGHGLKTCEMAERLHLSPKPRCSYQSRISDQRGVDSTPKLRQRATLWFEYCNSKSVDALA